MTLDRGAGAREQRPAHDLPATKPLTEPAPEPGCLGIGSFEPELGGRIENVTLAYESWGELDETGTNAVLVVHALTGDAHAAGGPDARHRRGGWWDEVIGPGKPLDTEKFFVLCSNVLGGCSGSTGPASLDPKAGRPYGMRFPTVTIRDMVRAQRRLLEKLGVRRLALVIGGSIGGQQALEWAVEFPDFVEKSAVVAATSHLGPQGIGMSEIGRRAITADPDWQGGDYYGTGRSPENGLAIARMAGMMTYQSASGQWERFGRRPATRGGHLENPGGTFDIECYLQYQGADLVGRFDANSYLYLLRAMDLYDVGAGYGSLREAFRRVRARMLFVGIESDWLFPAEEVRETVREARGAGVDVSYAEIGTKSGHDAFLKDWDELRAAIRPFVEDEAPRKNNNGRRGHDGA
ncbi:homoserine O-acetyltransferase [Rubrobacter radiotolerans]|uniref:Homoserine O-acetyltransferase n=1 Tax=Rubrobacter radiotolerans TaxID=42256 RepID=A0A023X2N4_RUBRA|nr:homoserine O-acetyltransferase [Rubrobacter radiotolerans]AHY46329.1 homoserine O-acetyltransferase [Rubrobacter radiotolerans]MDX5893736.1 homoserine O-acetyltransferase [Rubrobacter radiotolerans]SMC04387.1 homoserine O-acetyltransferase [Rubrobacter radiotolerans DSM 5868]